MGWFFYIKMMEAWQCMTATHKNEGNLQNMGTIFTSPSLLVIETVAYMNEGGNISE